MLKFRLIILAALSLAAMPASAQIGSVSTAMELHADSSVRTISAAINAKAFFQNDEIESPMMKGYTLPGFRLSPTLRYRHGANASIEAGAYLLHYWGASLYPRQYYATLPEYDPANSSHGFHALPFLRARLATNFGLTFVLGDIYGGSAHGLIEPLYSRELDLTADPEAGIQMLYGNRWIDADMWADWRTFIFNKSPYCENFIYGISAALKPTSPESRIKVDIPLQLVIEHIGGEIDTLRRVNTLVNLAAGASIAYRFPSGPIRSVGIEACYMASKQVAGKLWTVESGHAMWAKASIDIAGLDISAAYYNDRHFCTLLGFPLFGDGSRSGGMATVSAAYSYRFAPGFELAADAKAYIMDGKASFCIGAAANINLDFTLKKISR